MTHLLVSVRSAAEAEMALSGGADLIDVKEPAQGSLGQASEAAIAAVCTRVNGRRPVSAALGEWLEGQSRAVPAGVAFVKWGLAGCLRRPGWKGALAETFDQVRRTNPHCSPVAVSYADWELARAPDPEEVCQFACDQACGAFLIDTWSKDGRTLLDWLTCREIDRLCRRCRAAGVRVALAGSLGDEQIGRLRSIEPDWFAVRGAVCRDQLRTSVIDSNRVRALVDLLSVQASISGS